LDLLHHIAFAGLPHRPLRAARLCSGTPLELSYWVSASLPLGPLRRQALLEADTAAERLRQLRSLLRGLRTLCCTGCGAGLAAAADVYAVTPEGSGGNFVNAHGYVHDMVTFKRLAHGAVSYEGGPVEEHSWFPGYAWTICYCRRWVVCCTAVLVA
jgi:cereblon